MEKITKIENKVELKDMEVQGDPCKWYWDTQRKRGEYDCNTDCYNRTHPFGTDAY